MTIAWTEEGYRETLFTASSTLSKIKSFLRVMQNLGEFLSTLSLMNHVRNPEVM